MRVVIIPLNSDNYGYLLINEKTNNCMVIDVSGQPGRIVEIIEEENVKLKLVLTTHKHWDHAGGNSKLLESYPDIQILGSEIDSVEGCNRFVKDGEEFIFDNSISVVCILTPGHTMGHMSYYCTDGDHKVVFTGDCLFVGGAGKFFEGSGSDMFNSLYDKLGQLPPETLIYCGHEYTLSNYKFALSCEPNNVHLVEANNAAVLRRQQGLPTIPSTMAQESQTNPFMRVLFPTVRALFPLLNDSASILTAVREAKNNF
jgi:hydroxyacylglutathione hydrolase